MPDKLHSFRCYNDTDVMVGVADVTLPDLTYMTESIKGAGIAGEIDSPAVGLYQSMSVTVSWRSFTDNNAWLAAPKAHLLDFRGSVQLYDEYRCEYVNKAIRLVMKGIPKKVSIGKFSSASSMDSSSEFEVIYLKLSFEKKELIEIDKFNFVCRIDGVDYLAKVRKDLGM